MAYQTQPHGTIRPQPNFDVDSAVRLLEDAMKGKGCDKEKLMQVIINISNAQRQQLKSPYKQLYGRDLVSDLKKELSGELEEVLVGLMENPAKYDAIQLKSAMKGLGTKESTLIDIICSRTPNELKAIKAEYEAEFKKTLESDVVGDTSGDFQHLLVAILQAKRDYSYNINSQKARQDARAMFGNPSKKEKPDKDVLISCFSNDNFRQLHKLFSEFQSIHGESIQSFIKRVFSSDAESAFVLLSESVQNKPRFFAIQLYDAMKGLGTRDADLIRIIISRSEIDLADIKVEFERLYKKPLVDWIKAECSGAYRDSLIAIVKGN